MKKHKSVVAILLAVMMIFTMMPAMAFAADPVANWDDDFKTVSYDGNKFQTEHVFGSDALTTVTAQPIPESSIGAGDAVPVPAAVQQKFYYDLTNSTLVYQAANGWQPLEGTKWANIGALNTANIGIAVVEQPGMKDYDKHVKANDGKPVVAVKAFGNFGTYWKVTKKVDGYKEDKAREDQPVTISAEIECTAPGGEVEVTGDVNAEALWGTIAPAKVTVVGEKMTPGDAGFYFDTVGNGFFEDGALTTWYDGSAHKVVADEVEGWTVSYAVYGTDGKYKAVDSVSITDVLKEGSEMKVRATFKDNANKKDDVVKYFTVNLIAPEYYDGYGSAVVTWNEELSVTDAEDGLTFTVPGSEYNTADYVTIYPDVIKDAPAGNKEVKAFNAAVEKAVAANQALIKEWFNDYYQITEKNTKKTPDKYTIRITDKDLSALSDEEKKALEDKYAQMLLNLGTIRAGGSATLLINTDAIDDVEVEFTKAITKKTFKGKKAIKKGKLKKNQTIALKAVSNTGAPVYYKLVGVDTSKIKINKTTGKITLKKGLKKGTYKIKVKAYVPYSIYERNDFFEYQTIKVKVNKK